MQIEGFLIFLNCFFLVSILGYCDEETHREEQDELLPLDCTTSVDVLHIGSKIRNFVDRRQPHELEFCEERTLIYLNTFA